MEIRLKISYALSSPTVNKTAEKYRQMAAKVLATKLTVVTKVATS